MAEAVLRHHLKRADLGSKVIVDSAGTGDWHIGNPMDAKARAALDRNGYNGASHRARQFRPSWLNERDLIVAMDAANLRDLRALAAPEDRDRIRLFGEIAALDGQDVPDPYDGTAADFARVLALLEEGASHLVSELGKLPGIS